MLRLSGPQTRSILDEVCAPRGGFPPPRRARLSLLQDADGPIDQGLLTWFEAPRSYTGEHSAELSCHGNPVLVQRLLAACVAAGARVADPGEFTRRAFLNGRLDLTRAEAVLQAIDATSPQGLAVAQAGLNGQVAGLVSALREGLTDAIAELEARLDHPAEDLVYQDDVELVQRVAALGQRARAAADSYRQGRVLVDGATVALVGPVNAGKSSLFNALGGSVRALVSDQPGTTRDVVERRVLMGSVAVTLLDTAGQREDPEALEAAGLALGAQLTASADLLMVVVPAHEPERAGVVLEQTRGRTRILVGNHADRPGAVQQLDGESLVMTSATEGLGLEALRDAIAEALVGELPGGSKLVIASARQQALLREVFEATVACEAAMAGEAGVAVAAEELYTALSRLDALDGRDTREAVLDSLFARFCIGK